MEQGQRSTRRLMQWIKKYKYALLVLLLGVVLLCWPTSKQTQVQTQPEPEEESSDPAQAQTDLEAFEMKLERILERIDGVGSVQVLLTLKTGPQYVYQKDHTQSESSSADEVEKTMEESTVVVSTGNSGQQALLSQTICPRYQGAVVVCQGADNAAIKLDLVNAVASLTGLTTDKITVIKMKGN